MSTNPLQPIIDHDQDLFSLMNASRELALTEGALSAKHKLLIALAIDVVKESQNGTRSLAQQALGAGASQQEIMEVLRIAHYICGVGCVYTAAPVLKDILG